MITLSLASHTVAFCVLNKRTESLFNGGVSACFIDKYMYVYNFMEKHYFREYACTSKILTMICFHFLHTLFLEPRPEGSSSLWVWDPSCRNDQS